MNAKLEAFLKLLGVKLEAKENTEALERDLENPEKLAETVSHMIGSSTRRISLTKE